MYILTHAVLCFWLHSVIDGDCLVWDIRDLQEVQTHQTREICVDRTISRLKGIGYHHRVHPDVPVMATGRFECKRMGA